MNAKTKIDKTKLQIFHEGRKRRTFVGELHYIEDQDKYEFIYDETYVNSKSAIPIGPDLDLFKIVHRSKKGKLFLSFLDRIPSRNNPAYKDYCISQGISTHEKNLIVLLGAIGKRGPSSFIYVPVYKQNEFSIEDVALLREKLGITQHDLANALDISVSNLQKAETHKRNDKYSLKMLQIFFEFPEVALWQLRKTGGRVKGEALLRLVNYFESKKVINDK